MNSSLLRPREVRRSVLPLGQYDGKWVRALNYDLREKKILLADKGGAIKFEADDNCLRQALFHLLAQRRASGRWRGEIRCWPKKPTLP